MLPVLVRDATTADLDALVEVYVAAFDAPPWNEVWPTDAARQRLSDLMATPRSVTLCAEDQHGGVVGLLVAHRERSTDADHVAVRELCVSPEHRRSGVGRDLVSGLDQRAGDASALYLLTMRDSSAADFWASLGFRQARRQTVLVRP